MLDNTGSMSQHNKLPTLTSAAQTLVATLMAQAGNDVNAVKISIVPFSMTVNVGQSVPGRRVDDRRHAHGLWLGHLLDRQHQSLHPVLAAGQDLGRMRGGPAGALRRAGHAAFQRDAGLDVRPLLRARRTGYADLRLGGVRQQLHRRRPVGLADLAAAPGQCGQVPWDGEVGLQRLDGLRLRTQRGLHPAAAAAPDQRPERPERRDRPHGGGGRHQPGDRAAVGLADAVAHRAVRRRGRLQHAQHKQDRRVPDRRPEPEQFQQRRGRLVLFRRRLHLAEPHRGGGPAPARANAPPRSTTAPT